jgi:outer membrane lipoprotein-sorting protein
MADPIDPVFARIDAAARTFKGMTADISDMHHTALIDSDDTSTGTIKLLKVKDGPHVLIDLKGAQIISLDGHNMKIFNPKTRIVDVFGLADKRATVDQFLLLGFGATSTELKSTYDVTYVNEEKAGGQQSSHLKLVPKSADTRRQIKQADLWYGSNGLVIQQKLLFPSGDFQLFSYSNMQLTAVPEKDLELKLPKNVTEQKH